VRAGICRSIKERYRSFALALTGEHGGEWARIEYSPQRADLFTPNLIPLDDERCSGGGVRDHLVKTADILAVCEHLLDVNSL
jgi:hypothetical protein